MWNQRFEPVTFCMPCMLVSSGRIVLGLVAADQSGFDVWGRLSGSGEIWARWYLVWSWLPDLNNRVHLDLRPYPSDDQAAEVARLRALGATDIDIGQGGVPWTCLADSEGNEFDVLTPL
jgi:Glyoxalase-like domain